MNPTTMTQVTVDGVMQGNGGSSDEDLRTLIEQTYARADAFQIPLELVESRVDARGAATLVYRPSRSRASS